MTMNYLKVSIKCNKADDSGIIGHIFKCIFQ